MLNLLLTRRLRPPRLAGYLRLLLAVATGLGLGATAQAGATPRAHSAAGSAFVWSSPKLIDTASPVGSPAQNNDVSCPTTTFCAIVNSNGNILTSTKPFTPGVTWKVTHIPFASAPASGACGLTGPADACLSGIACPSATLCVAVGSYLPPTPGNGSSGPVVGALISSTAPGDGPSAWTLTGSVTSAEIEDVACPSITLCVAVDSEGDVLVSSDPSKAGSWKATRLDVNPLMAISCATVKLCVAVDNTGQVLRSTAPATGRKSWVKTQTPTASLSSVSCPSAKLCTASDQALGQIVVSTNPAGASPTWKLETFTPGAAAVYCQAATLCFASDSTPNLRVTKSPTAGTSYLTTAAGLSFRRMACASSADCVLTDGALGPTLISTSASTSAAGGWTPITVNGNGANPLGALACQSTSVCVVGDDEGRILSFDPAGGQVAGVKTAVVDASASISGLSCAGSAGCVAVGNDIGGIGLDGSSIVLSSVTPSAGTAKAWKRSTLPAGTSSFASLDGVSCPAATHCVASDATGAIWESSAKSPVSGPWTQLTFDGPPQYTGGVNGNALADIACPSSEVCVAAGGQADSGNGTVYSSDGGAWLSFVVDPRSPLETITCPSIGLCVAGDGAGNVVATANPLGSDWTLAAVDGSNAITGVSCPRSGLCVAVDAAGNALSTTTPTATTPSWTAQSVDPGAGLTGVVCPSASLCVAADDSGRVLVGRP